MSDDAIFHFNINTLCDKGIVSTLYPVFTTQNINPLFLYYALNYGSEFRRYVLRQKQGGSRTYMYFSKLEDFYITLPSEPEQDKIVSLLVAIDEKIKFEEEKLKEEKKFKNAFLQQMFI